jgi:protein gp37
MGRNSAISWTDDTWNPVRGCSHISEGCRNCYAEALSHRYKLTQLEWTKANERLNVVCLEHKLDEPLHWKKPRRIFVNSISDTFNDVVPDEFLARMFDVMSRCPQHTFQVLTKRIERAAAWPGPWMPNIWLGTSVEDRRVLHRVDALRESKAQIKFISAEPLLGPLAPFFLDGIDWVIAGGESGPHYRPMKMEWAREILDLCLEKQVPFFFKQDSDRRSEQRPYIVGRDGSCWMWHQYPEKLSPPNWIMPEIVPPAADPRVDGWWIDIPAEREPSRRTPWHAHAEAAFKRFVIDWQTSGGHHAEGSWDMRELVTNYSNVAPEDREAAARYLEGLVPFVCV